MWKYMTTDELYHNQYQKGLHWKWKKKKNRTPETQAIIDADPRKTDRGFLKPGYNHAIGRLKYIRPYNYNLLRKYRVEQSNYDAPGLHYANSIDYASKPGSKTYGKPVRRYYRTYDKKEQFGTMDPNRKFQQKRRRKVFYGKLDSVWKKATRKAQHKTRSEANKAMVNQAGRQMAKQFLNRYSKKRKR